jgi:hypothetical protein
MPDKKFDVQALFDVQGRTAVITRGSGHLGRVMASVEQMILLADFGVSTQVISEQQHLAPLLSTLLDVSADDACAQKKADVLVCERNGLP